MVLITPTGIFFLTFESGQSIFLISECDSGDTFHLKEIHDCWHQVQGKINWYLCGIYVF